MYNTFANPVFGVETTSKYYDFTEKTTYLKNVHFPQTAM